MKPARRERCITLLRAVSLLLVMRGLDPRIQRFAIDQELDRRIKSGDDEEER